MSRLNLRAGDWVEVRSRQAILSTLDDRARLEGLPFMPEMFACCGRRYRVWKRAHKTCDTVNKTGGRRMKDAVHLQDVRCDGVAHGGCQAACLVFWKEAWLKRVDGPTSNSFTGEADAQSDGRRDDVVWAAASVDTGSSDNVTYSCQATLLPLATTPLAWWDMRQYVEDYTSGNVTLWQLASGGVYVLYFGMITRVARLSGSGAGMLIRFYDRWAAMIGGTPFPRKYGSIPPGQKTPSRPLHLKAGDLVQVRSYSEILSTLDGTNRNRGLFFDAEEVPYCGQIATVHSTVNKIIDEKTGRMLTLKDHNVILKDVYCQARFSDRRMFCPRAIYSYWRETWLDAIDDPSAGPPPSRPE